MACRRSTMLLSGRRVADKMRAQFGDSRGHDVLQRNRRANLNHSHSWNPYQHIPRPNYHSFTAEKRPFLSKTNPRPQLKYNMGTMSHQSGSSRFRGLFEAALRDYEKTTNITLTEHPLAEQLQNCHSDEPIITILQNQAREIGDVPGSVRIMKSIKNTVSILSMLATLGDAIDMVCPKTHGGITPLIHMLQSFPPAKAIQTALAILLVVCALF